MVKTGYESPDATLTSEFPESPPADSEGNLNLNGRSEQVDDRISLRDGEGLCG